MTIVAQVIKNKSEQAIFTISPEATVLEAITIMAEKGIGALVVAEGEQWSAHLIALLLLKL